MDPENLSVLLIEDNVASKIILFLISAKRGSPYKSTSFLTLSDNESEMDFTLFIIAIRFWEKLWQCRR